MPLPWESTASVTDNGDSQTKINCVPSGVFDYGVSCDTE